MNVAQAPSDPISTSDEAAPTLFPSAPCCIADRGDKTGGADGGLSWAEAHVDRRERPNTWQRSRYEWKAEEPGSYELCYRARDSRGETQPLDQFWTGRGMGNNAVHRVKVLVV
jgi:hypothetical protein